MGKLSREELDDYAGQYAHVVAGLPRWLDAAVDAHPGHTTELGVHAREEATCVAMWGDFGWALRPDRASVDEPNAATTEFLRRCDALAAAGHRVAVSWALESQSPEGVAAAKAVLAGLWDLLTSVDRTPAAT